MRFYYALIVVILFLNNFAYAVSDAEADQIGANAILGAALAIQMLIVGAIFYFIKFLYKKIMNK